MRYLGGKKLIANDIADIVSPHIRDTYHEPFCGGLWVSVAIAKRCKPSTTLFLSDIHPDLIMLYQALYNDDIELPEYVTREQYQEYRHKEPSALRGFIGFGTSFGGKWFGGYAGEDLRKKTENKSYCKETKNRLLKHFEILKQFQVQFSCNSFMDINPNNSIVYCDPPYSDTTSYNGVGLFNHERYYKKLKELSTNNTIFCSEYSMPFGDVVWETTKTVAVNRDDRSFKATERLYKLEDGKREESKPMQFQVLQESLKRGLNIVSRVAPEKSTLPVLANVLLTVNESGLDLAATNIEMGIRTHVGARVEQHGAITLPAKLLSDVVANLPNAPISFKIDMESMSATLTSGRFKTVIKGIDADDFPIIPQPPETAALTLQGKALREAINSVAYAVSDTNDTLKNILFRVAHDSVTLTATDTFRLGRYTITGEFTCEHRIAVSASTLVELARVVSDSDSVDVNIEENRVLFSTPDTTIISQLRAGNYPDVEMHIARLPHANTRVIVDKSAVVQATKLASNFVDKNSSVTLLAESEHITLTSNGAEIGSNTSEVPALVEGYKNHAKFNPKFILDTLSICKEPQISLAMTDETKPVTFMPIGNDNSFHLIYTRK